MLSKHFFFLQAKAKCEGVDGGGGGQCNYKAAAAHKHLLPHAHAPRPRLEATGEVDMWVTR